MIPAEHVVALSACLFTIGVAGAIVRRSWIAVLASVELMFAAAALAFVGFDRVQASRGVQPAVDGQVFALLAITAAAAVLAVGIALVVAQVRNRDSTNPEDASVLRW